MPIASVPIFQTKPMTVLPGQATDVAELQRKSALANALMQNPEMRALLPAAGAAYATGQ